MSKGGRAPLEKKLMTSITESGLGEGKKDLTVSMTDRDVSKSQVGNIISEESSAANDENIKYQCYNTVRRRKFVFPSFPSSRSTNRSIDVICFCC